MLKKALLPLLIATAITGCNDKQTTTVDGSSNLALDSSLGQITGTLPALEQIKYVQDVTLLRDNFASQQLMVDLNGKNAQEIMAAAQQLRETLQAKAQNDLQVLAEQQAEQSKQRDIASIRADIEKLKAKRDAEATKNNFVIESAAFTHTKNEVTDVEDPVINLLIANKTGMNVFGASLEGTLSAPGETDPLYTGLLDLQLEKNLLPGEYRATTIKPSIISEWRTLKAPENASLALTVKDLRGETGESLIDGLSFSKEDEEQLSTLAKQLLSLDPQAEAEVSALISPAQPAAETSPEAAPASAESATEAEAAPADSAEAPAVEAPSAEPTVTDAGNGASAELKLGEGVSFTLSGDKAIQAQIMPEAEVSAMKEAAPAAEAAVTATEVVKAEENAPDFSQTQAPTEAVEETAGAQAN